MEGGFFALAARLVRATFSDMRAPAHPLLRRDSLPVRGIVLLWTMLFLGLSSGLEAYGHAGCPHHDIGGAAAHVGHAAAAHHDAGDAGDADHGHGGACTCIGDCSAAAGVVLLAAGPGCTLVVGSEAAATVAAAYRAAPRRALIPHVIPYGQAPPLAI